MSDVSLSAAVRDSLLSLKGTASLIQRTQNRLSTGLKVASPIDDPVAFFQAKALNDRASDFTEKKDGIDQGISTVTAALDGVTSIESTVRQLKGIASSMKSASATQLSDLIAQFNDLRDQINNLATDSSYQGTNLIAGSGQTLGVEFSDKTAARLDVTSVDLTVSSQGLAINTVALQTTAFTVNYGTAAHAVCGSVSGAGAVVDGISGTTGSFVFTWAGANNTTYASGDYTTFAYGDNTLTVNFHDAVTYDNGDAITVNIGTAAKTAGAYILADTPLNFVSDLKTGLTGGVTFSGGNISAVYYGPTHTFTTADNQTKIYIGTATINVNIAAGDSIVLSAGASFEVTNLTGAYSASLVTAGVFYNSGGAVSLASGGYSGGKAGYGIAFSDVKDAQDIQTNYVAEGDTDQLNSVISELDSALTTLRTKSQTLGTNVALLNTRLSFTQDYVNTLQGGSSKLTLADINEEGANLLALQTRQQLGISALSFAGQAEQSVLSLFR